MEVELVPFDAAHLEAIGRETSLASYLTRETADAVAKAGPAFTARVDGAIVAAGGFVPRWPGVIQAWAVIGRVPLRAWPRLTALVTSEIDRQHAAGARRIEAAVDPASGPACRWIKRLGFEVYGYLKAFTPDGRDVIGMARIRWDRKPQ